MTTVESKSDSTIPSYLYDGLCDRGEFCSCSINGRSHSYSNEILKWTKKDLEAYQKAMEDDATSRFRDSTPSPNVEEELPQSVLEYYLESPSHVNPSTPSKIHEDQVNLVVPDTPEEVIASRGKKNPKKRT